MNKETQERVLSDYANGKISFERLAEELDINFYTLHQPLCVLINYPKGSRY